MGTANRGAWLRGCNIGIATMNYLWTRLRAWLIAPAICLTVVPSVAGAAVAGKSSPTSSTIPKTHSWPMFRGSPGLVGVAPGRLPDALGLLWSFKTGGPVKSSAAVEGGRVFIGSDDGFVYAIDLESGKKA